jgi:hypothetical protein
MGDGQVLEGMEVADVDSHLLDSLPKGELVASTALRDGMRDIIEPSGDIRLLRLAIYPRPLELFCSRICGNTPTHITLSAVAWTRRCL